jgi:hypothetical protein
VLVLDLVVGSCPVHDPRFHGKIEDDDDEGRLGELANGAIQERIFEAKI